MYHGGIFGTVYSFSCRPSLPRSESPGRRPRNPRTPSTAGGSHDVYLVCTPGVRPATVTVC